LPGALEQLRQREGRAISCWIYDDGGRAAAGFKGETGDCVVRAIAISTGLAYRSVYDDMWEAIGASPAYRRAARSGSDVSRLGPRHGIARKVYEPYLFDLGWRWHPTMTIGSGTTVHLDPAELPHTRDGLIVRVSKHITVVRNGAILDTHDPSRGGRRAVYGYYKRER
jgi:hypothetical protein